MKDAPGAEDLLYLFFAPTDASQAKGRELLSCIFSRERDRDAITSRAMRDALLEAIIDFQYPREFAGAVNRFLGVRSGSGRTISAAESLAA